MKKVFVCLFLALVSSSIALAGEKIEITLKHGSEDEQKMKARLQALIEKHDVSKWVFTRSVVIDERATIPYSHPVLTLGTKSDDDLQLLSTFLHEQLHWFEDQKPKEVEKAIAELRCLYPDVPKRGPEGAKDEYSTYLHIIVCLLEYDAMRDVVGEKTAKSVMEYWTTHHYRWVYRTILADEPKIRPILDKHGLRVPNSKP